MTEYLIKLQKNIFAITLGASVFLGFSLAYLFSVILQYFFHTASMTVSLPEKPRVAPTSPFRDLSEFEGICTGNFIRDVCMQMGGPGGPEEQAGGDIVVQGILAGDLHFARAAIQVQGEEAINEYKTGQTVAGYKIVAIHAYSITVERAGNVIRLGLGEKSGEAQQQTSAPQAAEGTTRVTLSRDKINQLLADPKIVYENKFAPVTRDGKILGLKLLFVPPNNFLFEIGARTGDILRRLNDQPLESTERMIQMYQSLKTANRLKVDLERSGKIITFELIIQ